MSYKQKYFDWCSESIDGTYQLPKTVDARNVLTVIIEKADKELEAKDKLLTTYRQEIQHQDKLIAEYRDRLTKQHVNFLNDFFYEIENGIVFKEDFIVQLKKLEQLLTNKDSVRIKG